MDTGRVWEKAMKRKTNFCLIQGQWVASCKALYLPHGICLSIGHPVPDELSLFSFKITQRKQATARTHPPVLASQSAHSSCPASFAMRQPQLPQELLRRNFCLCRSFPNLWTHTLVHLWQAAAASWPPTQSPPHPQPPSSAAPWDICVLWGKWAGKLGELQSQLLEQNKGAPTAELYNSQKSSCVLTWRT